MVRKIGLIAGGGTLPLEFTRAARKAGNKVVVFAIEGMASAELEKEADRIYWLNIGQFKKFLFLLLKNRVRELALLGNVRKNVVYNKKVDSQFKAVLKASGNRNDYSILKEITKRLAIFGIKVIDPTEYLGQLVPSKGILSSTLPNERVSKDISFGYGVAKNLAESDIGQTVIVKNLGVVAVEAMEGTDSTIERAYELAGPGCVMVKVSRPDQDMRWDIPTVGPGTMEKLVSNEFSALALESDKMFIVEKEKMIKMADSGDIVVEAL